jgi:hypothetical protein
MPSFLTIPPSGDFLDRNGRIPCMRACTSVQ